MGIRNEYVVSTMRSPAETWVLEDPSAVYAELCVMSDPDEDCWRLVTASGVRGELAQNWLALSEWQKDMAPATVRGALASLARNSGWTSLALNGRVVWEADSGDLLAYRDLLAYQLRQQSNE